MDEPRFNQSKWRANVALVLSAIALVVALTGTAAVATGVVVTSRQIKDGTIRTEDLHSGAVRSSDLKNGAVESSDIGTGQVTSADIGTGQVTPQDLTLPEPVQFHLAAGGAPMVEVNDDSYALVATIGTYQKHDAASALKVDWTGTVQGIYFPCVFQLRVNGVGPVDGAGEIYTSNANQAESASASVLFKRLDVGSYAIQVWARTTSSFPGGTCTIGPAEAGVTQTFVVSELIT